MKQISLKTCTDSHITSSYNPDKNKLFSNIIKSVHILKYATVYPSNENVCNIHRNKLKLKLGMRHYKPQFSRAFKFQQLKNKADCKSEIFFIVTKMLKKKRNSYTNL